MAVEEATRKGLIDKQYEQILSRAEKAVSGYKENGNQLEFKALLHTN